MRVIFSHGGEVRELLWDLPRGRLIYRRRFILLSAILLVSLYAVPSCVSSLVPSWRLVGVPSVRFVLCRPASRPCVSPRVSSFVSSCVLFFCLLGGHDMAFDMGAVSSCVPSCVSCLVLPCVPSCALPCVLPCVRLSLLAVGCDFHIGRRFALLSAHLVSFFYISFRRACRSASRSAFCPCVSFCVSCHAALRPVLRLVPASRPTCRPCVSLLCLGVSSRPCVPLLLRFFCPASRFLCLPVGVGFPAAPFHLARRSSLAPPPPLPASPFPSFPFLICVPVRLACRLAMSFRRASRLMRPVASCRPSCRLACSSRRLVPPVVSFRAVSFCCSLVLVLFVGAVLPCVLMPSRSRLVIASRPSSRRLILFSPVISFLSHPWASRIRSRAWFPCSRRSVLLFARSCSSCSASVYVLGRGAWPCRYGHGAAGACSSHLIRPIMAPCLWRFACGGSLVA